MFSFYKDAGKKKQLSGFYSETEHDIKRQRYIWIERGERVKEGGKEKDRERDRVKEKERERRGRQRYRQ